MTRSKQRKKEILPEETEKKYMYMAEENEHQPLICKRKWLLRSRKKIALKKKVSAKTEEKLLPRKRRKTRRCGTARTWQTGGQKKSPVKNCDEIMTAERDQD